GRNPAAGPPRVLGHGMACACGECRAPRPMGDQRILTRAYARTGMVRGGWGAENGPRRPGVRESSSEGLRVRYRGARAPVANRLTMSGQGAPRWGRQV